MLRVHLDWHPNNSYAELIISDGSPVYPNNRTTISRCVSKEHLQTIITNLQHNLDMWKTYDSNRV